MKNNEQTEQKKKKSLRHWSPHTYFINKTKFSLTWQKCTSTSSLMTTGVHNTPKRYHAEVAKYKILIQ